MTATTRATIVDLLDLAAGLRRAVPLHAQQPGDERSVPGERLIDEMEAIGAGGESP